ncbi:MAG TPA: metallophosphatase domain-containing protein [Acidobacteriaceae bacterium]
MAKVRIICISDTHGKHAGLLVPDGDILIHAGDFMTYGNAPREIVDFNAWLGRQPHRHKIVIAGNHDRLFESHPIPARALITNGIYLEDSGVELDGLTFWGSPVQPPFNHWAFNVERGAAIRRHWDKIPLETDVLVTHGPPCGILDQTGSNTPHLGCEELTKVVENIAPRLHLFGHIHGGHGRVRDSAGTEFVNASVLNEMYMLVHEPQVVDLEI